MRFTLGSSLLVASLVALGTPRAAQAQTYGPYTFDANSWVTSASFTGTCSAFPSGSGTCDQNVVGHSPAVCAANLDCAPGTYVEMFFGNTTITNGPGVDLVVFATRFSTDAASIAVESAPGVWTSYATWAADEQTALQPGTGCAGQTLTLVPVDISRFGLPLGATTKRVRVGGNDATGFCQFDLTMAGVPIGAPQCVSNTDCNDGNPCTIDTCTAPTCSYTSTGAPGCGPTAVCGNGTLEPGEACDDGNTAPGDGCSNACQIEVGFACTTPGMPCTDIDECELEMDNCHPDARCVNTPGSFTCTCNMGYEGDGVTCVDLDECALGTDDCDENATCTNTPGVFSCTCNAGFSGDGISCATVCGDGIVAGAEGCDDGNATSGDGCHAMCVVEGGWTCGGSPSVCQSGACGDGFLAGVEGCDDGNAASGDGCSSACVVEEGYACSGVPSTCTSTCPNERCSNDPIEEGSCACSVPGSRDSGGDVALAAGLLSLALATRRRLSRKTSR